MNRYHLNPTTGEPGLCKAVKNCPFGDLDSDHYSSVADAYAAFGATMKATHPLSHSKHPPQYGGGPKLEELITLTVLQKDIEEGYVAARPHEDNPHLMVLCYTKDAQFDGRWTEATTQARGLIIYSEKEDLSDAVVVERPWRKFFTLQQMANGWSLGDEEAEGSADELMASLDFNAPAEVTDKSDGSMGVLYHAPDGLPALATKGSFSSTQAVYYTKVLRDNEEMLADAKHLLADKNRSHLFELVGPENRIVLSYEKDDVILLGSVEKATGIYNSAKASQEHWHGTVVESFQAKNLAEAVALPDREGREGLVVRVISEDPAKQLQIKFKQEDYKALHRIFNNYSFSEMRTTLRGSPSTFGDLLHASETGDIAHIKGVGEAFSIEADHPTMKTAVDAAMIERKRKLEAAILPRIIKLRKARDFVDELPASYFSGENPAKNFAALVNTLKGYEQGDLFNLFQARLNGRDINKLSAKKILAAMARNVNEKTINEE